MTDTVGLIAGAWDFLHPGHLAAMEEAHRHCGFLIAALQTDPTINRPEKNRPVETTYERWTRLAACSLVDALTVYDTELDLRNLLLTTKKLDAYFVGDDWRGRDSPALAACAERGIPVHYLERKHSWSSSGLRNRIHFIENVLEYEKAGKP